VIEQAGPAKIRTLLPVSGRIVANEDRLAHIMPRYPGIVKAINKKLGDRVDKGEMLAVVESNESLQPYEVKAEIAGTVTARSISLGEFVSDKESIFTVADLATVWADFPIFQEDFPKLREGQKVLLRSGNGGEKTEAEIIYLSPFGAVETQTMLARAAVPNPKISWRPGIFVDAEIIIEEREVPVAVKASALQTFRDWDVVFMRDRDLFEIAIVEPGERDGEWVEVKSGLPAGARYATENSFVVKADVMKSGAVHEH
jgi:cobalt-zinc-cadmium efflux system membrane fusion protein